MTISLVIGVIKTKFLTMEEIYSFLEWKNKQSRLMRGGYSVYDIKGCHKFLHENELFDYYTFLK